MTMSATVRPSVRSAACTRSAICASRARPAGASRRARAPFSSWRTSWARASNAAAVRGSCPSPASSASKSARALPSYSDQRAPRRVEPRRDLVEEPRVRLARRAARASRDDAPCPPRSSRGRAPESGPGRPAGTPARAARSSAARLERARRDPVLRLELRRDARERQVARGEEPQVAPGVVEPRDPEARRRPRTRRAPPRRRGRSWVATRRIGARV